MISIAARILRSCDWIIVTVFVINFFGIVGLHEIRTAADRSVDSSNLRELIQGTLIYANYHNDQLPPVKDVWDYARVLAQYSDLDTANLWLSKSESVNKQRHITVLASATQDRSHELNPAFQQMKLGVAVAVGTLDSHMPSTTPIMWTRGLRADGTWSKSSPHRGQGGHIVFLSGFIGFFPNVNEDNQFVRFDGKGSTSNILEALPPGTRISEYQPTPEDETAWWRIRLWRRYSGTNDKGLPIFWIPLILVTLYRVLRKKRQTEQLLPTAGIVASLLALLIWKTC